MSNRDGAEQTHSCKHTEGPGHNCAYVDERNALIPLAERNASRLLAAVDPARPETYRRSFAAEFFAEMDRLWAEHEAGVVHPWFTNKKRGGVQWPV